MNKILGFSNVQQKLRRTAMIGLLGAASATAGAIVPPAVTAGNAAATATSASNSIRMSQNRHSGRTMHFGCTGQCGDIIIIRQNTPQQMRINDPHQIQQARAKENKVISMWNKILTGLQIALVGVGIGLLLKEIWELEKD